MLRSMTGFGTGRAKIGNEGEEIVVEVRSLNHKFCEVKVRLPRELSLLEPGLTKAVKKRIVRGAVEVAVKRQGGLAGNYRPVFNLPLAQYHLKLLADAALALGVAYVPNLNDVIRQPEVLQIEQESVDLLPISAAVISAAEAALEDHQQSRLREGKVLDQEFGLRLNLIRQCMDRIALKVPQSVERHRRRLSERIAELTEGSQLDPQRLAQEVALFADRTDVAEELTRLTTHLDHFRTLVNSLEPAGRKMDFLVQEMNREINTIGSKCQNAEMSEGVVLMKAEVERIREQVQNAE